MSANRLSLAGALVAFGPGILFGVAYLVAPVPQDQKIFAAAGAHMVATLARLILLPPPEDVLAGHLFDIPWLQNFMILAVGGAGLWLQDEMIIKMGPTVYFGIVGGWSAWTVLTGTPRLQRFVRRDALRSVGREGWRNLTIYASCACILMAAINELVWRTGSTGFWVAFQIFGWGALEMSFMALSMPILRKHDFRYSAAATLDHRVAL